MTNTPSQGSQGTSQLDTTLGVLQSGLADARDIASDNIAGWIKTLQGNRQLASIGAELQALRTALDGGEELDATTLARHLQALGEHTAAAAASATPDAQDKLRELGQALSAAANQAAG